MGIFELAPGGAAGTQYICNTCRIKQVKIHTVFMEEFKTPYVQKYLDSYATKFTDIHFS